MEKNDEKFIEFFEKVVGLGKKKMCFVILTVTVLEMCPLSRTI